MQKKISNSKHPTIYDLAELTNTSASTVGSVLNGTWRKRRISVKLAEKILDVAKEKGYSPNMQARALRKERSGIVGMILPMYDNRYFSSIAESFEQKAREMGFFPIVTCTRRDPDLELEAARSMLNHRIEYLICTGATDPDKIANLCKASGTQTINIDLPGSESVSIISDNFSGAINLTTDIISRVPPPSKNNKSRILFIGGKENDHNTKERMRGFREAHKHFNLTIDDNYIRPCGYAGYKTEQSFDQFIKETKQLPSGIFVNSTISLEGIMNWFRREGIESLDNVALGCFDWDPFAALMGKNTAMVRQNVPAMMDLLFQFLKNPNEQEHQIHQINPDIIRA